jgi:tRNA(Ile)-lysidine synthase
MGLPAVAARLPEYGRLVIGVSGGPDSLCLLDLARRQGGLALIVAHFNHRLRPEADQEAEVVRAVAERMSIPFAMESADVRGYAAAHRLSLEQAARLLRYRFLFSLARSRAAQAVAVGHTADDQVETILMHFLRGSGLDGLKGIAPQTLLPEFDPTIPLVRPILHLWRAETEAYCLGHGLSPLYDRSNQDERFLRNRVRLTLIPQLESYNPGFKRAVQRMGLSLAGDYDLLDQALDPAWQRSLVEKSPGYIALRTSVLEDFPSALRRSLLRRAIETLRPGEVRLDFGTLERAAEFTGPRLSRAPGRMVLSSGLHLFREGEVIYLAMDRSDLPTSLWPQIESVQELAIGGHLVLAPSFSLTACEISPAQAGEMFGEHADPFVACLDADQTGDRFTLRTRQQGDRFRPLGLAGRAIKLSDYFVNVKLPERARARWPLVVAGGEIAWVPGFVPAYPFRITPQTRRAIQLSLRNISRE